MDKQTKPVVDEKTNLHKRNKHRNPYNFPALIAACPQLAPYVSTNKYKNLSVDFKNPDAVKMLNKALLIYFYKIQYWDIPKGYLCPPIPGRVDYIHYVADLLANNKGEIPKGSSVKVLDVGVGANCIYPLLGHKEYGWSFVGAEVDAIALKTAQEIVNQNGLADYIELRKQASKSNIFKGIIKPNEKFDITICNPPFHSSAQDAMQGTDRKWKNLGIKKANDAKLNFGGRNNELWCNGGEERFVKDMIAESAQYAKSSRWFSSLISKKETLKGCYKMLEKVNAINVKTINMAQGQKTSRILVWSFIEE